jgi:hypothetical protein
VLYIINPFFSVFCGKYNTQKRFVKCFVAEKILPYGTFVYVGDGLTGPSAKINGQYLYEIWPDATATQVRAMYCGATGLSDCADIPSNWK